MTERKARLTPEGFKIRRVYMQPHTVIRIVPPGGEKVLDQEELRVQQDLALGKARRFFHANAQDIAYTMAGGIEDLDRIDAEGLRDVNLGLRAVGLGVHDVLRSVRTSLQERPFGDTHTVYSRDALTAYGALLADDRRRLDEETLEADAAPKPRARKPKTPKA